MSKELIERLRADAEATDDIGLCADAADRIEELERELECERIRLAACGVAALGYFDGCKDEFRSASLDDTLRLVEKNDQLREQVTLLREIVRIAVERGDLYINDQIQAEAALAATEEA